MKIVLDTNVLVSGLLKPYSSSGTVVRLVAEGAIQVVYDIRILNEYREVLLREKFNFDEEDVEYYLSQLEAGGLLITAKPTRVHLPDRDDEPFLEVAGTIEEVPIVTGNRRHFPKKACGKVRVLGPSELIDKYFRK